MEKCWCAPARLSCHLWTFDMHEDFFLFKLSTHREKPVTCQLACLWGDQRECFWFEFECFGLLVLLGKVLKLLCEQISWFKAFKAGSSHVSGYFHPSGQVTCLSFLFFLLNEKGPWPWDIAGPYAQDFSSELDLSAAKFQIVARLWTASSTRAEKKLDLHGNHCCLNFKLIIIFLVFYG